MLAIVGATNPADGDGDRELTRPDDGDGDRECCDSAAAAATAAAAAAAVAFGNEVNISEFPPTPPPL